MSKKTEEVRKKAGTRALIIGRGNSKPKTTLRQIGQMAGKGFSQALYTAWDEGSSYPPVTVKEADAFCRIQIKRCNMNLSNAKDRGDKRAVINLERKLAVYEYLQKLVLMQPRDCYWATEQAYKNGYEACRKDMTEDFDTTTACPHCLVHAVGKDGVCSCCGQKMGVTE